MGYRLRLARCMQEVCKKGYASYVTAPDLYAGRPGLTEAVQAMGDGAEAFAPLSSLIATLTRCHNICSTCRSKAPRRQKMLPPTGRQAPTATGDSEDESDGMDVSSTEEEEEGSGDVTTQTGTEGTGRHPRARWTTDPAPSRGARDDDEAVVEDEEGLVHDAPAAYHDDYFGGPTLEDLQYFVVDVASTVVLEGDRRVLREPGAWDRCRDNGWRLKESFHAPPQPPHEVGRTMRDAFLALPATPTPPRSVDGLCMVDEKGNVIARHSAGDLAVLDAGELADAAEEDPSPLQATVLGKLGSKLVVLDPSRAVELPQDDIVVTSDVDGLIWVTQRPRVKDLVKVRTNYHPYDAVPVSKDLHVEVEVLPPLTDAQKLARSRSWKAVPFGLHKIPNVPFAEVGDIGYIAVFFPRMIRRVRRRHMTAVPFAVQDAWFRLVVIPSVAEVATVGQHEYYGYSAAAMDVRSGPKKGVMRRDDRKLSLSNDQLERLVDRMRFRVRRSEEDDLSMFGSFFFVLNMPGTKHVTMHVEGSPGSAWENATSRLGYLDWEAMLDRSRGTLYLDLGVAWHQREGFDVVPHIAFHDLHYLRQSYREGGMRKPTEHPACTVERQGGAQATAKTRTRREAEVQFRSSYSLGFEALRRPGEGVYFCKDSDAYHATLAFDRCIDGQVAVFGECEAKAFGARDEMRALGGAVRDLCEDGEVYRLARRYVSAAGFRPLAWVPSGDWFRLLALRLKGLKELMHVLADMQDRPPNFGTLAGLVMDLVRRVSTTPSVVHPHVGDALKELRLSKMAEVFGMFFLSDLDLHNRYVIPGLRVDDTRQTALNMGAEATANVRPTDLPTTARFDGTGAMVTGRYPIGSRPTRANVHALVARDPASFMGPWEWEPALDADAVASRWFVQMTRDLLGVVLNRHWIIGTPPVVNTLEEAMRCWSVQHVKRHVREPRFLASDVGLGGSGEEDERERINAFVSLGQRLFPTGKSQGGETGIWTVLKRHGYLKGHRERAVAVDQVALKRICCSCQCLPHVTKNGLFSSPKGRGPSFQTNPVFYRMVAYSNPKKTAGKVPRTTVTPKVLQEQLVRVYGASREGRTKRMAVHMSGSSTAESAFDDDDDEVSGF